MKTEKTATDESAEPTMENWREVAIFHDGSGLAGETYDLEMARLEERMRSLREVRRFVQRHLLRLAGARWQLSLHGEPEIDFFAGGSSEYRGRAEGGGLLLARIFPEAGWVREPNKYIEERIDWVGEVEGVRLRIRYAEAVKVEKPARPRGPVDLGI